MIFLEKVSSSLTLAVMLEDEVMLKNKVIPDTKAFGNLFLKVEEGTKAITRRSSIGHFLLIDLPKRNQKISCGGDYYIQGELNIKYTPEKLYANESLVDLKSPVASITLSPNSSYPFPEGMTILKGKITDENSKPIHQASITVIEAEETKISEDNGGYFFQFPALGKSKPITLKIEKDGYKSVTETVSLKKESTTHINTTKLIKS